MNFFNRYMGSAAFAHNVPGESGSTPAPSGGAPPSGTPAPSGDTAVVSPEGGDQFSSFGDDDLDSIDLGTGTDPSPEPAPAVTPAAPAKPAPAVAAPAKPEAAPVVPAPAPAPKEASAPPPSELDSLVQSLDGNAAALTDWLSQNAFALTKEEADAFELDAVASVPKLMARVAVNSMKSTMNIVKNLVPQMIAKEVAKITSTQTKAKEAIGEFYSSNPHLNEKDHGELVTKWANAYRAANPKASRKDAIDYVGRAVSFEAGIAPGTKVAAVVAPAPFQPARPGGRQPIATTTEVNPFAGLGSDHDEG